MIYRILTIIAIILATVGYTIYQNKSLESNLVSDQKVDSVLGKMPASTFETLDGQAFSLEEFYKREKPALTMVHFWGTWCAPCEAELPELMTLMKRFEGTPQVHFLLVAANDESIKIKKFLKDRGIDTKGSIQWLLDNKNVYRDQFGTTRVPETFVFSSDMTTLRKFIGPQNWTKPQYFQTFDELLQISTRKL